MSQLDSSIDPKTLSDDVRKAYQEEEKAAVKMRKARDKYAVAREKIATSRQALDHAKDEFAQAQTTRRSLEDDEL